MPGTETPPLIVGNWKMHGRAADIGEARAMAKALAKSPRRCAVVLCPPATLLATMSAALRGRPIATGGQTCHAEDAGAFTGEISAAMLADAGAAYVILGHSERRRGFGESDGQVAAKVRAAVNANLQPIICVGETLAERATGQALSAICGQVMGSVPADLSVAPFAIAYEPVWAIGANTTPTSEEIAEAHAQVRSALVAQLGEPGRAPPILYGGSMTAENAARILRAPGVGGLLVGRAALRCSDFLPILATSAARLNSAQTPI